MLKSNMDNEKLNNTPSEYFFWELAACWVWKLAPWELFLKTRKTDIVHARYFAMDYSHGENKISLSKIAKRYGLKQHGMVLYASEKVGTLCETEREYKEKHDLFLKMCKVQKSQKRIKFAAEKMDESLLEKTAFNAWKNYAKLMTLIGDFKTGEPSNEDIYAHIMFCELDFNSLKRFFEK